MSKLTKSQQDIKQQTMLDETFNCPICIDAEILTQFRMVAQSGK